MAHVNATIRTRATVPFLGTVDADVSVGYDDCGNVVIVVAAGRQTVRVPLARSTAIALHAGLNSAIANAHHVAVSNRGATNPVAPPPSNRGG